MLYVDNGASRAAAEAASHGKRAWQAYTVAPKINCSALEPPRGSSN
jgi:hypothetical protein